MALPLIASLMQKAGGAAGIMGGARDAASDKKNDKDSKNLESIQKSSVKLVGRGFMRTLGIGLGIFGLLRMSKGLSAVVSSFFQILGAFVDVVVAPFLPMIFKGLGKLTTFIPEVQRWAQGIFNTVSNMEGSWLDKILAAISLIWDGIYEALLKPAAAWLQTNVIDNLPTWAAKFAIEAGKQIAIALSPKPNLSLDPVVSGIAKGASWLADKAADMATSIATMNTFNSSQSDFENSTDNGNALYRNQAFDYLAKAFNSKSR